jgi:hypothetical protein
MGGGPEAQFKFANYEKFSYDQLRRLKRALDQIVEICRRLTRKEG